MKITQSRRRFGFGFGACGTVALAAAVALSCAAPAREVLAGGSSGGGLASDAGLYEVEVLLDGRPAPRYSHAGESYVMGQIGRRYTLRVWNRSGRRIEAVVSVDGRDVIDGKPGDFRNKRGYLVPAWGFVDVDGWRLSEHQAAAFRFTSVANSYVGRLGSPRHVGVIGVAVFPELARRPLARPVYPYPHRYPYPERSYRESESDDAGESARAEEGAGRASKGAAPPPAAAPAEPAQDGAMARNESARAPASPSPSATVERQRPGLGTEFGEAVSSPVQEVSFLRANSRTPELVLGLRYNDRRGLLALGIDVDGRLGRPHDLDLRQSADPFPVSSGRYASPPVGWRR